MNNGNNCAYHVARHKNNVTKDVSPSVPRHVCRTARAIIPVRIFVLYVRVFILIALLLKISIVKIASFRLNDQ